MSNIDENIPRLFAIDVSGSTSGSFYYNHLGKIFNELCKGGDRVIFWSHEWKEVDINAAKAYIAKGIGSGGTYPKQIIDAILSKHINAGDMHLILVTDGEISVSDIDQCDAAIKEHGVSFAFTTVYIIGRGIETNLSVCAPFSRYCGSRVITLSTDADHKEVAPAVQVSKADMELLNSIGKINTFEELMAIHDSFQRALTARVLGTNGDQKLHDELVAMQGRIAKNFVRKDSTASADFAQAFDADDLEGIVRAGSQIVVEYNTPGGFESTVQALIRISDGGLRHAFTPNHIASARASRAAAAVQVDVNAAVDVIVPDDHATFQCPLTIDNETDPCIIIAKPDQPLLVGREKAFTNLVVDCPLNVFINKDFTAEIAACIDHPMSLKAVREAQALGHPITTSPITRRPVLGFIPLGAHESHAAAADWTLSRLFSGGTKLGNRDLWFAVLWGLVSNDKIPYLSDMKPFVVEQMLFRLRTHRSSATLTGLPGFVQTPLRLDCAIFFTLACALFRPAPEPAYDPLRAHMLHVRILLSLLGLTGHNVPASISSHISRTQAVLNLLQLVKKRGKAYLANVANALVQNVYVVNPSRIGCQFAQVSHFPQFHLPFVPLDGPPTRAGKAAVLQMLPPSCRAVSTEELYAIMKLVDPLKSAVDIQLPLDWAAPSLPAPDTYWAHYDGSDRGQHTFARLQRVRICEETLRPYYMVPQRGLGEGEAVGGEWETWPTQLRRLVGNGLVFSPHRYFMDFATSYKRYPSLDELLLYTHHRILTSDHYSHATTLLSFAPAYVRSVFADFATLTGVRVPAPISMGGEGEGEGEGEEEKDRDSGTGKEKEKEKEKDVEKEKEKEKDGVVAQSGDGPIFDLDEDGKIIPAKTAVQRYQATCGIEKRKVVEGWDGTENKLLVKLLERKEEGGK